MSIKVISIFNNSFLSRHSENTKKYLSEKKSDKDFYSSSFKTNAGEYELNVHLKHDKLLITCESYIEFLSLYTYSKEITFEELKKLYKTFKSCNDNEEIFKSFKNILRGITIKIDKIEYKSQLDIMFTEDDSLIITIKIPLIYEIYEEMKIVFEKKQKSILEQYKNLRNKYIKVKDIISYHQCGSNYYSKDKDSLSTQIKRIENEDKKQEDNN